jgi:hypothetical protein
MAGKKLNARVRASTLLEVIVSMVIIVLVFSIAMMIYSNVTRLSLSAKKIRAAALLEKAMNDAEHTIGTTNRSFTLGDLRIEQETKSYGGADNLTEIHLTAFDENQEKVAEMQKIIPNQP